MTEGKKTKHLTGKIDYSSVEQYSSKTREPPPSRSVIKFEMKTL